MEVIERLKTGIKTGLKLSPAECEYFYDELARMKQENSDSLRQGFVAGFSHGIGKDLPVAPYQSEALDLVAIKVSEIANMVADQYIKGINQGGKP